MKIKASSYPIGLVGSMCPACGKGKLRREFGDKIFSQHFVCDNCAREYLQDNKMQLIYQGSRDSYEQAYKDWLEKNK